MTLPDVFLCFPVFYTSDTQEWIVYGKNKVYNTKVSVKRSSTVISIVFPLFFIPSPLLPALPFSISPPFFFGRFPTPSSSLWLIIYTDHLNGEEKVNVRASNGPSIPTSDPALFSSKHLIRVLFFSTYHLQLCCQQDKDPRVYKCRQDDPKACRQIWSGAWQLFRHPSCPCLWQAQCMVV